MDALLTKGDLGCFVNVFFNISGTVMGIVASFQLVMPKGNTALVNKIIFQRLTPVRRPAEDGMGGLEAMAGGYEKILAGMTVTMLAGNFYYAWMAKRLMKSTGRQDVTALPYGINTPAAFAFIFNVIGVSVRNMLEQGEKSEDDIQLALPAPGRPPQGQR
ncbi:unnamed protein product [Prorocentrum cordatum]|uniref:Uncharacterized protein n=1 Tax=Prorocentrum cordatum TaxID=2364126 RepID=A0ABN9YDK9_9DINO|nr:unnamed protein product [Polarella glacialis]